MSIEIIEIEPAATENETMKRAKEAVAAYFAGFESKKNKVLAAAYKVFAAMGQERLKQSNLVGSVGFLIRMPKSEFFIEGDLADETIVSILDHAGFDGVGVRGTRGVALPKSQGIVTSPIAVEDAGTVPSPPPKKEEEPKATNAGKPHVHKRRAA